MENVVIRNDYHVTLLHLFGLDPEQLVYLRNGQVRSPLDDRPGRIVRQILERT